MARLRFLIRPSEARGCSEHVAGLKIFHTCVTDVHILHNTFRFRDAKTGQPCTFLLELLGFMRQPGGRQMPDHLWKELQSRVVADGTDPRLKDPKYLKHGFESAIQWQAVMPLMQYRAVRDAKAAEQIIMYSQAVDIPPKGDQMSEKEYISCLRKQNINNCGSRMGLLPTFKGMRVRLTDKINAPRGLVQDATGVIEYVILSKADFDDRQDWQNQPDHEVWKRGYVRLRRLPEAVIVKLDDFDEDVGFGPGRIAVKPSKHAWKDPFVTKDVLPGGSGKTQPRKIKMSRIQIPFGS